MHPILGISEEEDAMPYMRGIRWWGGTIDRLIDNEIMLILSNSQLVSSPLDCEQGLLPSRPDSHIVLGGDVPEEQLYHSPIIGDDQLP